MLKIVVTGAAGRMGRRLVANIAEDPELVLVGATERPDSPFIGTDAGVVAGAPEAGVKIVSSLEDCIKGADAVVDFSTGCVVKNAETAFSAGAVSVIGTTALTKDDKASLATLAKKGARIVQTTNFSVGVNLLFYLAGKAAKILPDDFDIEVVEAHHNKKKDAPSGTAVTLSEVLCAARGLDTEKDVVHGRNGLVGERKKNEIGVHAVRGGDIVGDHTVMFAAPGERIELIHRAGSRDTFARGALKAAKFLVGAKAGLYDMRDVLGLKD